MAGEELLIVDPIDRDREGLRRFFDSKGFVCTAARSANEARELVQQKFFPAALIDLDVDGPNNGLEVLRFLRERSAETALILLTNRRAFEPAVQAFRLGAHDVIEKSPDHVEHMRSAVEVAVSRYRAKDQGGQLYRDLRAVLNDSFKVMLELSRRVYADLSMAAPPMRPKILFVDGDGDFLNSLAPMVQKEGWEILADTSGGGALDRASRDRVDIMVVRSELPDLRGSMVIKSIQAEKPDVIALLYNTPGADGHIDRLERGQVESVTRPFTSTAQLVGEVKKLTGHLATKAQERRLIQAFRADHTDFLRRFAKVKSQVDNLVED
jgi:DNA-binding NtrC family response regulator